MQNRLRGRNYCLQAAAVEPIHSHGGSLHRDAATQSRHARQVHIFGLGVNDVSENNMPD